MAIYKQRALIGEDIWTDRLMKKRLLSPKFKEMIAITISATNKCYYCTSAHTWAIEYTGTSKEITYGIAILDFNLFESKGQVELEFTRRATIASKSITQEDMNQMKKHFSDTEIVEISAVIMAYRWYNTFVEILGLEIYSKMDRGLVQTWS